MAAVLHVVQQQQALYEWLLVPAEKKNEWKKTVATPVYTQ